LAQESEDGQEKTEEPSARKQSKAREQGQVPRSRELSAFVVLLFAAASFIVYGHILFGYIAHTAESFFSIDREILRDTGAVSKQLIATVFGFTKSVVLFIASFFVAAFVTPVLMGGWNFSPTSLAPKLSKLNPIKGLKKMFSVTSLIEVVKSIGKFFLISIVAVGFIYWKGPLLMGLTSLPVDSAMLTSIETLGWAFLLLVLSLSVIVAIDVPFQLWNHTQQLKMTKQEVKDEHKDTEGKPEVKRRIRQLQYEATQRRMMEQVAEADVVITNPTHYAVALRYDQGKDEAPILLAKGKNLIAFKIRDLAKEHQIQILEAPMLARSVFHTTELGQEIPAGLYVAVAQVLAYVHQVRHFNKGQGAKPNIPKDFQIPSELQFD